MAFVLDASVAVAWILPDEENPLADHVANLLLEHHAFVPAIWWFEVRNTLIVAERHGRLSISQTGSIRMNLAGLPVLVDREVNERDLMDIARTNTLTVYNASYVELARRTGLPLATLDKAMVRAAKSEGIDLLLPASR
jgi:predicted nucleic acid-binding protein